MRPAHPLTLVALVALVALVLAATPALALRPSNRYAADPRQLGIAFEDVSFRSSRDSVRLHGWWFDAPDTCPVLVVCPSETGNMADKLASVREWVARGYRVLTFDLRDCGPAAPATPDSLRDLVFCSRWANDTEGALGFARGRAGARPVVVWGQDLGGALAIVAADRHRGLVDAVATEGLFRTSQEQLQWLGLSQDPDLTVRHRILVQPVDEPMSAAARLHVPVFSVIAGKDEVTPPDVTRRVLARVPWWHQAWEVPQGGHEHLERTPGYFDHVAAGLQRALDHRPPPPSAR